MGWVKKLAIGSGVVLVVGLAAAAITIAAVSEKRPVGETGPAADELAQRLETAVNLEAWEQTGAVEWKFAGRRTHLWDRKRSFARFVQEDLTVWIDLTTRRGLAERSGEELSGEDLDKALENAWSAWVNDSFWLNPIAKLRDEGVTRSRVTLDGDQEGLLVSYASGGVTPGDAYLWIADANGMPKAWKMWTSVIPVGGARASWEGWKTLSTGAKVSTMHEMKAFNLELTDIKSASRLSELYPVDPFDRLIAVLSGS